MKPKELQMVWADGPAGTPKVINCGNNQQIPLILFASGLILHNITV